MHFGLLHPGVKVGVPHRSSLRNVGISPRAFTSARYRSTVRPVTVSEPSNLQGRLGGTSSCPCNITSQFLIPGAFLVGWALAALDAAAQCATPLKMAIDSSCYSSTPIRGQQSRIPSALPSSLLFSPPRLAASSGSRIAPDHLDSTTTSTRTFGSTTTSFAAT